MAKQPQAKHPAPSQTVAHLIRLLDASRATTGMHTFEHFHRSLGVWEAALRQVKMQPWLEACRGLERGLQPLSEALAVLLLEAQANYHDVLGAVYMELGQGDKRFGQFFTPDPIAWFMAEMVLADFKPPAPGAPPLRILEPCCGSGVMILASAGVIESRYPGAIGRGEVEFYGMDLDAVCVAMCRLNMLLHGIGRKAQTIDALTPEQRSAIEQFLGQPLPAGRAGHTPSDRQREPVLAPSPPDPLRGAATTSPAPVPFVASTPKIVGPLLWTPVEMSEPHPQRNHQARFRTGPAHQKASLPDGQPTADQPGQWGLLPADEAPF